MWQIIWAVIIMKKSLKIGLILLVCLFLLVSSAGCLSSSDKNSSSKSSSSSTNNKDVPQRQSFDMDTAKKDIDNFMKARFNSYTPDWEHTTTWESEGYVVIGYEFESKRNATSDWTQHDGAVMFFENGTIYIVTVDGQSLYTGGYGYQMNSTYKYE